MPMNNYCDLHTHSCCSDGSCTPEEIIGLALQKGLSAVALTDHNTIDGLPAFLQAAAGKNILAIPGVEISTGYGDKELHIVGLFVQPSDYAALSGFLNAANLRKEESNRRLIHALSQAGFLLDYDSILRRHPTGTVNRAVIAAALLEKGYVTSVEDAFQRQLHPRNGFYVPPERISAFEAIRFLSAIHAVPVLAHPFLNLSEAELRQFLPEAKKQGLAAMETVYSSYSPETEALAGRIAAEFGLLRSGGSDFHGSNKPDISIGIGRGNLRIPTEFVKQLQEAIRK